MRSCVNTPPCFAFNVSSQHLGQQFIHLAHGQRLESKIRCLDLREKFMSRPTVIRDGFWRQPTFLHEVVGKFSKPVGITRLDGDRQLQLSQKPQSANATTSASRVI